MNRPTKIGKTTISSQYSKKKGENEEALVMKEMALSNLGKNIFISDSAATSHMTSNKLGVLNLIPINRSVMIGNGQSISLHTQGKIGCHLQPQGVSHSQRNLGCENCTTAKP